jgi:hypothetical protein
VVFTSVCCDSCGYSYKSLYLLSGGKISRVNVHTAEQAPDSSVTVSAFVCSTQLQLL